MAPGGSAPGRLERSSAARSASRRRIVSLKAGRSPGLREVTRFPSSTTSRSTHFAPALSRSVRSDGHDVTVRPSATSASISIQGAWQIAATSLPWSKNARVNATMGRLVRSLSGE